MKKGKNYLMMIFIGLILISLAPVSFAKQEKFTVALFTSRSVGDAFWGVVADIAKAACDDLGMNLKAYYANSSLIKMREQVEEATSGPNKVDALIIHNFNGIGYSAIDVGEKAKVPIFLFNAGIDYGKVGKPREKYKYWIGEMLPNDEKAGYDLANFLIKTAKKNGKIAKNGKVHLVAVSGPKSAPAAIEREKGLKRAIKTRNDVELKQIVNVNDWRGDLAEKQFGVMMRRYPETTVGWSASDIMSIGIIRSLKKINKQPGKDLFTGGVDWASEGLEAVIAKEMSASAGGHILEGGWVSVLLYDYLNGIDFSDETVMMRSNMHLLTMENIQKYIKVFGKGEWDKIDFRKFSKKYNSGIKKYDFSMDKVLSQF